MKLIILALALIGTLAGSAQAAPNASDYSYKVWGAGALPRGRTSSANTPFGKLTCAGGGGVSMRSGMKKYAPHHRDCHW